MISFNYSARVHHWTSEQSNCVLHVNYRIAHHFFFFFSASSSYNIFNNNIKVIMAKIVEWCLAPLKLKPCSSWVECDNWQTKKWMEDLAPTDGKNPTDWQLRSLMISDDDHCYYDHCIFIILHILHWRRVFIAIHEQYQINSKRPETIAAVINIYIWCYLTHWRSLGKCDDRDDDDDRKLRCCDQQWNNSAI